MTNEKTNFDDKKARYYIYLLGTAAASGFLASNAVCGGFLLCLAQEKATIISLVTPPLFFTFVFLAFMLKNIRGGTSQ